MGTSEKRTQIYLPASQHRILQSLARRRRTSMAAVVREALLVYAAQQLEEAPPTGDDPLADLIGCFDAEPDLSTRHDDHIYRKKHAVADLMLDHPGFDIWSRTRDDLAPEA